MRVLGKYEKCVMVGKVGSSWKEGFFGVCGKIVIVFCLVFVIDF